MLPARAGWIGIGILFGLLLLTGLIVGGAIIALDEAGQEIPSGILLLVGGALLYGPLVGWCYYASRRWGSGSLTLDLGVRFRPMDLAWGGAALLSAYVAIFTVMVAAALIGLPAGTNTEGLGSASSGVFDIVALYLTAVVAAPIVEELFFRGLVLRALTPQLGVVFAILVQGVFFGIAHLSFDLGLGAISLVLALSAVGWVYGLVAWHTGRIGSTILAHALQNTIAVTLALLLGL